ncbi:hypothetical protein WJX73_009387 [Symbiochloris irregularis]|uniref:Uncharacterized protein n=1 Tax=Symbiochloris irregularis TaxID=706552 RepID=A0AAW1NX94_9CHLO
MPDLSDSGIAADQSRLGKIPINSMEAAQPQCALFGVEECQVLDQGQGSRTGQPSQLDARPRDFTAFFAELGQDTAELRSPPRRPSCPARPPDHRAVQRRLFPGAEPSHPRMHSLNAQVQEQAQAHFKAQWSYDAASGQPLQGGRWSWSEHPVSSQPGFHHPPQSQWQQLQQHGQAPASPPRRHQQPQNQQQQQQQQQQR